VPLIISQISSHNHALVADYPSNADDPWVSLAQFDAANSDPRILLACPTYMFDFQSPEHYNERGHRIIGHYYALVYEAVVLRGQTWKHIKPLSSARVGSAVYVRYQVPVGALALDTSWISDPGNYGFQIFDSPTGSEMTISSVELLQGDTVKIVCSAPIPAGAQLRYGFKYTGDGTVYGRTGGPRGNLRDSAGDSRTFAIGDSLGDWAAHNYCPIHDYALT
jgi:hypothetical protein